MENPRNTPRLETPRLILRRFVPEDAPALWELLRDREVNRFLPWFPVETLAEAEKFLRERFLDTYRTETGWRYAVCLREEPERPVGYVNIAPGEAHDLGYGLEKVCWHRGLMTLSLIHISRNWMTTTADASASGSPTSCMKWTAG